MQKQNSSDGLKNRLDSYSAAATSNATAATLRQRMGNWSVYAAVTGSALAAATSASAFQIVSYSGPQVTATLNTNNGTAHTGVQIGIAPEFFIAVGRHSYSGSRGHVQLGTAVAGVFLSKLTSHSHLRDLASGQAVSSHAGNWGPGGLFAPRSIMNYRKASTTLRSSQTFKYFFGRWKSGVPGFVGFRLSTTNHLVEDYGWAKVEFQGDANGVPDSVTLLGLAYNASGAPILTPTPEPDTAGLVLLALGAAGVTALRKNHGQHNESAASDSVVTA